MSGRIIITIAQDGATQVRTEGIAGSGCLKASESMERALGVKASERLTNDYFRTATAQSNNLQQGENK